MARMVLQNMGMAFGSELSILKMGFRLRMTISVVFLVTFLEVARSVCVRGAVAQAFLICLHRVNLSKEKLQPAEYACPTSA